LRSDHPAAGAGRGGLALITVWLVLGFKPTSQISDGDIGGIVQAKFASTTGCDASFGSGMATVWGRRSS